MDIAEAYGKHYGMTEEVLPKGNVLSLQDLFRMMMDAVRSYFFQILAWVDDKPEHLEIAERLVAPSGRWIERNRQKAKEAANGETQDKAPGKTPDSGKTPPPANGDTPPANGDTPPANGSPPANGTPPANGDTPPANGIPDTDQPLPQTIIDEIDETLPERQSAPDHRPDLFPNGWNPDLIVNAANTQIWVTFVKENANNQNALGYFTYSTGSPPSSLSLQDMKDGLILTLWRSKKWAEVHVQPKFMFLTDAPIIKPFGFRPGFL